MTETWKKESAERMKEQSKTSAKVMINSSRKNKKKCVDKFTISMFDGRPQVNQGSYVGAGLEAKIERERETKSSLHRINHMAYQKRLPRYYLLVAS